MQIIVVVSHREDWPLEIPDVDVVDAKTYIANYKYETVKNAKVFNLCRSYKYQSLGYYVSLLATARGHKPQPDLITIQDFKSPTIIRIVSDELDDIIQSSLKSIHSDKFVLSIYFGKNVAVKYDRLSTYLYKEFRAPLLRAFFEHTGNRWAISSVSMISGSDIPLEHRDFVISRAQEYFAGKRVALPKKVATRYDLAVLHCPEEQNTPSNAKAIQKFTKAAENLGFRTELITKDDYGRIAEFDALFIRETTNVNHHTFRFARRAAAEGLVVIDDPQSILNCTNKVFLAELMERYDVPIPKTLVIDKDTVDSMIQELSYPFILKQPDGSFSQGVIKINNLEEFNHQKSALFKKSELLIAQEYMPTDFDWRVGVLDGQPLFVAKYYMAKNHWQIYQHLSPGRSRTGNAEAIAVENAPKLVLQTALRAANLIGKGFYGVDLKQVKNKCYVIEINDNPNVDYGVEDDILHDELYHKIMLSILQRIEKKKQPIT